MGDEHKMLPTPEILESMAKTFRDRSAVYKDNYKMVSKLMKVLFPDGVPSDLVVEEHFHLFELLLVKISRYAVSNLQHQDSIHDAAIYCAMCEAIVESKKQGDRNAKNINYREW